MNNAERLVCYIVGGICLVIVTFAVAVIAVMTVSDMLG